MRISISLVLSALIVGLVSAEEHHGAGSVSLLTSFALLTLALQLLQEVEQIAR